MLLFLHRVIEEQILSLPFKFQVISSIHVDAATFSVQHVKKCEHNSKNAVASMYRSAAHFAVKRPSKAIYGHVGLLWLAR